MAGSPATSSGAPHVCCLGGQRLPYAPCLHCDIRHLSVCGALDAAGLAQLQRQVGHECFEPARTIVTEGEVADRGGLCSRHGRIRRSPYRGRLTWQSWPSGPASPHSSGAQPDDRAMERRASLDKQHK